MDREEAMHPEVVSTGIGGHHAQKATVLYLWSVVLAGSKSWCTPESLFGGGLSARATSPRLCTVPAGESGGREGLPAEGQDSRGA